MTRPYGSEEVRDGHAGHRDGPAGGQAISTGKKRELDLAAIWAPRRPADSSGLSGIAQDLDREVSSSAESRR